MAVIVILHATSASFFSETNNKTQKNVRSKIQSDVWLSFSYKQMLVNIGINQKDINIIQYEMVIQVLHKCI